MTEDQVKNTAELTKINSLIDRSFAIEQELRQLGYGAVRLAQYNVRCSLADIRHKLLVKLGIREK